MQSMINLLSYWATSHEPLKAMQELKEQKLEIQNQKTCHGGMIEHKMSSTYNKFQEAVSEWAGLF